MTTSTNPPCPHCQSTAIVKTGIVPTKTVAKCKATTVRLVANKSTIASAPPWFVYNTPLPIITLEGEELYPRVGKNLSPPQSLETGH